MLEVERGIAPNVIEERGYYTETDPAALAALGFADYQWRAGLVIPEWTTAGVQRGHKLRPDKPRAEIKTDPATGKTRRKPIKYENPAGGRHHIDVPPGVVPALPDPTIPLYFTEGSPKADAAWSHGLTCISLGGVWAFLRDKRVIPDFDDIEFRGRLVRIAFDSDIMRKASVREALDRLAAALERRGAIVEAVYLSDGPNGEKVGLDDFFAAGGTVVELEALTRPWSVAPPPMAPDPDDPVEKIARLQRERDEARRAISTLIQVCLNPNLKATEKVAYVAAFGLVQQKRERGDVDPDGTVRLSAAEVSNDYRPKPEPGEHVAPVNPKDGSRPRMSRDQVLPIMRAASARNILHAHPHKVTNHRNGASFHDTEWAIVPPASLDDFLAPAAGWCPEEPKVRKPRQQTCPHCQEPHAIVRTDTCQGCGSIIKRQVIEPPEVSAGGGTPPPDHLGKISSGEEPLRVSLPPAPPPRSFVGKISSAAPTPVRWLETSAPVTSGNDRFDTCLRCNRPLPPGHRYQCGPCAVAGNAPPHPGNREAAP